MILKFKTCAITTMLSKFTYDTMVNLFATQCWGECAKEIHRSIPLGSIENDYLTFDRSYLKKNRYNLETYFLAKKYISQIGKMCFGQLSMILKQLDHQAISKCSIWW